MWFWLFVVSCDILIPVVMIIAGRMMWKHPPKNINNTTGYRTNRSMKNMDTWKFAQEHCGRLWWKIGWIVLVPSIIVHIPVYGKAARSIGIVSLILLIVQLILLIGSIFPTERALKRTFTDAGLRR